MSVLASPVCPMPLIASLEQRKDNIFSSFHSCCNKHLVEIPVRDDDAPLAQFVVAFNRASWTYPAILDPTSRQRLKFLPFTVETMEPSPEALINDSLLTRMYEQVKIYSAVFLPSGTLEIVKIYSTAFLPSGTTTVDLQHAETKTKDGEKDENLIFVVGATGKVGSRTVDLQIKEWRSLNKDGKAMWLRNVNHSSVES
ncbi:hypothetical protein L1987_43924 [Smallanthus sonchifolius]|uniref:Uncharacterized protein n=1 Tax=Smallanthus sonchifolius TaxID=185202 RepID=A0ACB9GMZ7_9ASTR|nr:hypothetical protein L1987_43924 [Smallanthus sonchifolius]